MPDFRSRPWRRASARDLPALLDFLLPQEWRAVPFTSRLLRRGQASLPAALSGTVFLLQQRGREGAALGGALLSTAGGLLLPVLAAEANASAQAPPPRQLLWRQRVYSVMGPGAEVLWLEGHLRERPVASVDYDLMVLERRELRPAAVAVPELKVREAAPADLARLFPLQRAYELEEVVVFPERFSDQACRTNLRRTLRSEMVLLAELGGRVVAKAGTNARGFDTDQIGGVFTAPSLRGAGIAAQVMTELLARVFSRKHAASLFVKKANTAAVALYRKLGFRTLDCYRISYYPS